jgi:hypothetical protein
MQDGGLAHLSSYQQFPLMIYESYVTMVADSSLSVSTIHVRFLKRLSRPEGPNVVLKVD